jgi:pantoate--beta-alanine ligase
MIVARNEADLTAALAALRKRVRSVGFVPTMGALHAGHLALAEAARAADGGVVASIFVNPLQFAPTDDFDRYPRDEAGDLAMLEAAGCAVAWLPDVATMYPPDSATRVEVGGPAEGFEGAHRPGHFRGVATVVARLFGQVRPDHAYFGEKDWQQVQVVRRMVADLRLPVSVVPVPTVRETDGLAMSSRNRYLAPAERALAPALHRTMVEVARAMSAGEPVAATLDAATAHLREIGFAPDYLALVDGPTLSVLDAPRPGDRLIAAARLGAVRLLDNVPVS